LELAAVAGPQFEVRVLARTGAVEPPALLDAVDEAARNGLVEESPGPPPAFRFTHELVRRAIYDRAAGVRRAGLHLRIGEALELTYAADPMSVVAELAHHFTLAAPVAGVDRGVAYNLRAAEVATAAAAFDEAAARLSSALVLGIADAHERTRVEVELAELLEEVGRVAESNAVLTASQTAANDLDDRGLATYALVQRLSHVPGDPYADPAAVQRLAEEAVATFAELEDIRGLVFARRVVALALIRAGRLAAGCAELERALAEADAHGHRATHRRLIGSLAGGLLQGPLPAEDAVRRCEELLRAYGDDRVLAAVVTRALAALLAMQGSPEEAREHARRSGAVLDELNSLSQSWATRSIAAEAQELTGDHEGVERELEAKWEWFRETRSGATSATAMRTAYSLALLYCDDGRWDDVERCVAYGAEVPVAEHFLIESVLGLAARGRLAKHRGAHAEGLALARHAVDLAAQSEHLNLRARSWLALAEVLGRDGRDAEAEAARDEAVRLYEAKGNVAAARMLRGRS